MLSNHLTDMAIGDQVFCVGVGGGWGWSGKDEYAAEGIAGLAALLGCEWGPHSASVNGDYENVVRNALGQIEDDPQNKYRAAIPGEFVKKLDDQTRRTMYLGGYLTN
jgi:hypothetical protein